MANAGFEIKIVVKSGTIEIVFKSWGPFRIYQLISTANPAKFHSYKAGLAVLISWWFQNGPMILNFFNFSGLRPFILGKKHYNQWNTCIQIMLIPSYTSYLLLKMMVTF